MPNRIKISRLSGSEQVAQLTIARHQLADQRGVGLGQPFAVRERHALSPEMALRLARLFGNSPEFWLNAQRAVDLWIAARTVKEEVDRIKPLHAA
ncbi:HigA family addiction module antitoxin [Halomonas jincaotanensis]|uniref:HigA family addiction module antitoxin n=1 Tax=Halomonas jincaotanensis TaxID=2810616 RepID=UPI0029E7D3FA|nr:HigA family addiction module antitoxin [Halomonas jincaotanensis]